MKLLLKVEEVGLFALSIVLFPRDHYSLWWYALLFLTPDISMLGYLINTRVGAIARV